ncbi:UDP-forming cellulose synthase catalytic subunit [Roseospira visakhapatnamensis]|uniref:Cellulose synthase catalytic subunit [UDP-forming] n=1 Tax=Roseospira visakhapatnamensis TaxID=390880 RepID=A0A7W6W955_9PROT|nr:UDP-forming cellulose synthase catalytic subunit [Roseospira visakhapatnamensis]MBB4265082.1 cellulose synthase (UDP-forming) [Roseospira visakhapatnamensis]
MPLLGWVWIGLAVLCAMLAALPVDSSAQILMVMICLLAVFLLRPMVPRDDPNSVLRIIVLFLALFISFRYFGWRTFVSLHYDTFLDALPGLILYVAEIYAFSVALLGLFVAIYPAHRRDPPPVPVGAPMPTVDVFIPTYNEDPDLLETTIRAACLIRYPQDLLRIYLLDDGGTDQKCTDEDPETAQAARARREHLQAMCQRLGITYVTRPRNEMAKAGNVNHAFRQTGGDLILILDADHVPTMDILENTVDWFRASPSTFLVQTPHFMINPDPIERNLLKSFSRSPSENEMFYRTIQCGLDFWDASFFCGSAAILRRSALEEANGFLGETITEDAETALDLHARGYRSIYLERAMVAGLSPETFADFVIQRMRWTQGMVQIFLLKNPVFRPGLSWHQRLGYINSSLFWFFPFARLVFVLAPLMYLILGMRVYNATLTEVMIYTVPHMIAVFYMTDVLFGRVRWPFVSELYEVLQSVFTGRALWQVIRNPRKPRFVVTPKGRTLNQDFISPYVRPFYVLLVLVVTGIFFGVWRYSVIDIDRDLTVVAFAWNLFNLMILLGSLGALLEQRQRRAAPRMPSRYKGSLTIKDTTIPCMIVDLSQGGARISLDMPAPDDWASGDQGILEAIRGDGARFRMNLELRAKWMSGRFEQLGTVFRPRTDDEVFDAVALAFGDSARWETFVSRRTRPMMFWRALWVTLRLGRMAVTEHFKMLFSRPLARLFRRAPRTRTRAAQAESV